MDSHMKTYDVIVSSIVTTQIEAADYKSAVKLALEYVDDLNLDNPRFTGVRWSLEQVVEAKDEGND